MPSILPVCMLRDCQHLRSSEGDRPCCLAFPNGIPDKYFHHEEHTSVVPGQVGSYVLTPGPYDMAQGDG